MRWSTFGFGLGIGIFLVSPSWSDQNKPLIINVNVSDSAPGADVTGDIVDDSGFQIEAKTGPSERYSIVNPDPSKVADLNYIIEISIGGHQDRLFLNVRDIHFGKTISIALKGEKIDVSKRTELIERVCPDTRSGLAPWVRRIIACKELYYTYDSGDYLDRFVALKGWFDSSVAISSTPSSAFRVDPDLTTEINKYETNTAPAVETSRYRTVFPTGYTQTALRGVQTARLNDLREITGLLTKGDSATAYKVNEFSTGIFRELSHESGKKYVNGVSEDLLFHNKAWLNTLTKTNQPSSPISILDTQ